MSEDIDEDKKKWNYTKYRLNKHDLIYKDSLLYILDVIELKKAILKTIYNILLVRYFE